MKKNVSNFAFDFFFGPLGMLMLKHRMFHFPRLALDAAKQLALLFDAHFFPNFYLCGIWEIKMRDGLHGRYFQLRTLPVVIDVRKSSYASASP
jgi:hypothetical protein